MHPAVLRTCVLLSTIAPCASALGHGEPPTATAVLSYDAEGPLAVRLSVGVALRRSAHLYQFVCPAAWGDQFPAALAALADGTLVVGATRGLMLLQADGTLLPHPDPAALGRSSEVVRSAQGVFAVRMTAEGSELLSVEAQRVQVLWRDPRTLYSLAAFADKLVLLRGEELMLEQVTLAAPAGVELERQQARVDLPLDYVFARAAAGQPYALVVLRNASSLLGMLRMNTFSKLADGVVSIAGPLQIEAGTLIAIDGRLSQLVAGQTRPVAGDLGVHCLDRLDGLSYACDREGISRIDALLPGEPLFRLSWLTAPNLEQVSEGEARLRCSAQWEDLRADLRLAGTTLLEDMIPDAGELADAVTGEEDAGAADAEASAPDASQQRGAERTGSSCSALPGHNSPRTAFVHACGLLLLALVYSRRFLISLSRLAQLYRMALLRSDDTRSAPEGGHARNQRNGSTRTRASSTPRDAYVGACPARSLLAVASGHRAGHSLRGRCDQRHGASRERRCAGRRRRLDRHGGGLHHTL